METTLKMVDPETGELIDLTNENFNYIDDLIAYYQSETNEQINRLKNIVINLSTLNVANQEKQMLLETAKIQLASM